MTTSMYCLSVGFDYTYIDITPCHRSKVITEFLKKNNIYVLEWPGNSPDLNPIDNLLTVIKDKVAYKQPSSADNLIQAIKEVWVTDIT